jgi:hypothetical protein
MRTGSLLWIARRSEKAVDDSNTHRLVLVLEHPKDVLNDYIVLDLDHFRDFLRYPSSQNGDIDFAEVDLGSAALLPQYAETKCMEN